MDFRLKGSILFLVFSIWTLVLLFLMDTSSNNTKVAKYEETENNFSEIQRQSNFHEKSSTLPLAPKNCMILLWAHIKLKMEIPTHSLCGGGCEISTNRTRLEEATAVIFMMKSLNILDLPDPKKRKSEQVYVWYSRETTWTTTNLHSNNLRKFNGYFNWTMNYRLDSDVDAAMLPFGGRPFINFMYKKRLEDAGLDQSSIFTNQRNALVTDDEKICELRKKKEPTPLPDISKKDKFSVWISRNCGSTSGSKLRKQLIQELNTAALDVNLEYSCIQRKTKKPRPYLAMTKLYDIISSHKFYLAFENGYHCREYVTEKLWFNSFYAGTVPVVWGARKEDYIRTVPSNSFIYYEDFSSPNELVNYLKYLDKNDTAYMEYFEWRKLFPCAYPLYKIDDYMDYPYVQNFSSTFVNAYCSLSRMLQSRSYNRETKIISSLDKYWFNNETSDCLKTAIQSSSGS